MKITAGEYKGRNIITHLKGMPKQDYRPTKSKVREAVFNIVQKYIPSEEYNETVVADLFCGCGTFGLEALSRGAKHAFFINQSAQQMRLVSANLEAFNALNNAALLTCDATALPPLRGFDGCNLIYIDPPYGTNLAQNTLSSLKAQGWIAQENYIIIEMGKTENLSITKRSIADDFQILDQRIYGKTKLIILRMT